MDAFIVFGKHSQHIQCCCLSVYKLSHSHPHTQGKTGYTGQLKDFKTLVGITDVDVGPEVGHEVKHGSEAKIDTTTHVKDDEEEYADDLDVLIISSNTVDDTRVFKPAISE